MPTSTDRTIRDRLGVTPDAAAWCTIGRIPEPPDEVHRVAGSAPLRPASMRPLAMLGVTLGTPLLYIGKLLSLLGAGEEALKRMLSTTGEQERHRAAKLEEKRRDEAVVELGLDKTFDGDWNGAAGRLLLQWYSHSSHHQRLVALAGNRILLAAPPQRVSVRRDAFMQVIAEIPVAEADLVDPLPAYRNDRLRLRFKDGSWLTLITEEWRSELHRYLRRHQQSDDSRAAEA
ncbi:hypothetical protein [Streptomyces hyaluromycini]|uniref:hypothetical protein n=1 Tax=Streptomyces hyaluromycini TaxID=1377993 RepID=UPI001237C089|nr:hypothetical protein [Streptomyces hyaluromycini]